MTELLSRVILSTESIVICVPMTMWLLLRRVPAQIDALIDFSAPAAMLNMAAGIFLATTLVCLWRLITTFVSGGAHALRQIAAYWWIVPIAAAVVSIATCTHWWLTGTADGSRLAAFAWSIPLLLPTLHLCLERLLRESADPSDAARPGGASVSTMESVGGGRMNASTLVHASGAHRMPTPHVDAGRARDAGGMPFA